MKNYVKPELFYERYELSQHIADCAWEYKFQVAGCQDSLVADSVQTGLTGALFGEGCEIPESILEEYCYQNSLDMNNTFVS